MLMDESLRMSPPVHPAAGGAVLPHVTDEQIRMILDMSRMLAVPTDVDRLLCRLAEISCQLLACERASIFLYDSAANELWTKVAMMSCEIRVPPHKGIVGCSFTQNEVVHVPDPYADPRFNPEPDRRNAFRTRNLLCAPMKGLDSRPVGVVQLINKAQGPFNDNDLALVQLLADQAGVAVQRHQLQMDAIASAAMKREMELARRAQEKLIPKGAPPIPGLEAAGWTLPASVTGGDCFDLWQLPDGRMGILLADASGHGLAPAMIVSQARSLVRAMSELDGDPQQVLSRVNTRLMDDLDCGQFVTAFLGALSPDGTLIWSSAGQGPVFVRPRPGAGLVSLDPPVQPLGITTWDDMPAPQSIRLEPGGVLLLASDGIFESRDPAGELFGVDRMIAVFDRHPSHRPQDLLAALRDAVQQWQGNHEPLDDQTIVIVRRETT